MAGEAADDDICAPQVGQAGAHVAQLFGMGEAVGEDGAVGVVDFDLLRGCESCLLEAEVEAADACEQAADGGF